MRTPIRIGAYALGLAVIFAAAVGAGHVASPGRSGEHGRTAQRVSTDSERSAHDYLASS